MFRVIYYTMIWDIKTPNPFSDPGNIVPNFLQELSTRFKYDTEHDFGVGSTRVECSNELRDCVSSLGNVTCSDLHQYVETCLNNPLMQQCVDSSTNNITDNCKSSFNSVCYTIRDTKQR